MTTVNTSEVVGLVYNWTNATFPWTDVYAGKLWPNLNVSSFTTNIGEPVTFVEDLGNNVTLPKSEVFSFTETGLANTVGLNKTESVVFTEALASVSQFIFYVFESVTFTESWVSNYGLNKSEAVSFAEAITKSYGLNEAESLTFTEAFTRTLILNLMVSENISFTEAIAKSVTLNKAETLQVIEEWVRRCDATISDMMISQGDLTEASFIDLIQNGNAPGFDKFREFIHGDYDYKQAIFRAVVKTADSTAVNLTQFDVDIDVPDMFDRGVATITDAANGINITFARPFHIIPEIVLSLSGGTVVAVPNAINKTLTGFTAILTNVSGTRVTGTISWAAHAY